jgi:hypothetical protein
MNYSADRDPLQWSMDTLDWVAVRLEVVWLALRGD